MPSLFHAFKYHRHCEERLGDVEIRKNKKPSDTSFQGSESLGFIVFVHLVLNGIQNETI